MSIPFFRRITELIVLLAWGLFSGSSAAQERLVETAGWKLSDQDKAYIEEVAQLGRHQAVADIQVGSVRFEQAQTEAKALYETFITNNAQVLLGQSVSTVQMPAHQYEWLIFASMSLGEETLRALFAEAAGHKNVTIVFRGIPPDANLGEALLAIHTTVQKLNPAPNIVINPVLFRAYNINNVPSVVAVKTQSSSLSLTDNEQPAIAQVSGLVDTHWLNQQIANGERGDLGIKGTLYTISEPDLAEEAKRRVAQIDWQAKKQQAQERYWQKQTFHQLPKAPRRRTKLIDPSIVITQDIITPHGKVATAGTVINPLHQRSFHQALIIFDPLDHDQKALIEAELSQLKRRSDLDRVVFIATRLDRSEGWESYRQATRWFDEHVYLLTPDILKRFELEHTPSVVTASGDRFVVTELAKSEI